MNEPFTGLNINLGETDEQKEKRLAKDWEIYCEKPDSPIPVARITVSGDISPERAAEVIREIEMVPTPVRKPRGRPRGTFKQKEPIDDITEEQVNKFLDGLAYSGTINAGCKRAEITRKQYQTLCKNKASSKSFLEAVDEAKTEFKESIIECLSDKARSGDRQAMQHILSKIDPERWGEKPQELKVIGDDQRPVKIVFKGLEREMAELGKPIEKPSGDTT